MVGDQLADEIIRDLFRRAQECRVIRRLIGLHESIQGPGLPSRPGRGIGISGERRHAQQRPGRRVEVGDLARAAVGAHEVGGHGLGVRRGDCPPRGAAAIGGPPLQRPKGHHAVDDDGILILREGPGANRPDRRIVEQRQGRARVQERRLVERVSRQPVSVAKTGPDDEADISGIHPEGGGARWVVRRGVIGQRGGPMSPPPSPTASTLSPDTAAKARPEKNRSSIPRRCWKERSWSTFRCRLPRRGIRTQGNRAKSGFSSPAAL